MEISRLTWSDVRHYNLNELIQVIPVKLEGYGLPAKMRGDG